MTETLSKLVTPENLTEFIQNTTPTITLNSEGLNAVL